MSRDQRSIDKARLDIDKMTRIMADPNRSPDMVRALFYRRQKLQAALRILEKVRK